MGPMVICPVLTSFVVSRGVQPVARRQPRTAMNVTQHKIINLLKTFFFFFAHQFSLVFVYLICGPEMPKGWTPPPVSWSTVACCRISCRWRTPQVMELAEATPARKMCPFQSTSLTVLFRLDKMQCNQMPICHQIAGQSFARIAR